MSEDNMEAETADTYCAYCGTAEIDDVKLKMCDDGCDLARYCSDECQRDHRERHEAICKQRAAELRDEILFRQPESSHLGDCPICFLPLPLDESKCRLLGHPIAKHTNQSCCGKILCIGCWFSLSTDMALSAVRPGRFKPAQCPFCREKIFQTKEETNFSDRVAADDPLALRVKGDSHCSRGDYDIALQYLTRAAELGDAIAHYDLSIMHREGHGVEKDEERWIYHAEEAAISGHPTARYDLGIYEAKNMRYDRAVKHWIIAANLGHNLSMQLLKDCYKAGHISKEDLAATLRAHHAAVDATKSPQREAAEKSRREARISITD